MQDSNLSHFSDVDAGDARGLIGYLDLVTRVSGEDKAKTFAAQAIGEGAFALDVGCGCGDDARAIAALVGPNGSVAGIEASAALVAEAKRRGEPANLRFYEGSAYALPFRDATFDAVRAERVFQHLIDPETAAAELRRVTKPGGSALLLDQDWGSLTIAGADPQRTAAIVDAFRAQLANPHAGSRARGLLRRAGFPLVALVPMVAAPAFPIAYDLILTPAANAATRAGIVDAGAASAWLKQLTDAEARAEFFCAVLVVVALGRALDVAK